MEEYYKIVMKNAGEESSPFDAIMEIREELCKADKSTFSITKAIEIYFSVCKDLNDQNRISFYRDRTGSETEKTEIDFDDMERDIYNTFMYVV